MRLDVSSATDIDMPAIGPPIAFKPVMSRDQLRVWADVDELLRRTELVLIVGYSFAQADEHFNDLLRRSNASAKVVVVNIDLSGPARSAARILGIRDTSLVSATRRGLPVLESGRLTCVKATAESVRAELLAAVRG